MSIDPGVYYVWNCMSNTALDICVKDENRVVGWAHHGGESQKWEIGKLGAGWFIRNVNNNHYLNIECGIGNSQPVGENEYPAAWAFATEEGQDGNVFWIHWPKTRYTLNLSGGYRENGTVVKLYERDKQYGQQLWRLIRVSGGSRTMRLIGPGETTTIVTTISVTRTAASGRNEVTVLEA